MFVPVVVPVLVPVLVPVVVPPVVVVPVVVPVVVTKKKWRVVQQKKSHNRYTIIIMWITIAIVVFVILLIGAIIVLSMFLKKAMHDLDKKTKDCDVAVKTANDQADKRKDELANKSQSCAAEVQECENRNAELDAKLSICESGGDTEDTAATENTTETTTETATESFTPLTATPPGIRLDSANLNEWAMPPNLHIPMNQSWSTDYLALANPKNYWNSEITNYNAYDTEIAANLSQWYCDESQVNCGAIDLHEALGKKADKRNGNNGNGNGNGNGKGSQITPDDISVYEQ